MLNNDILRSVRYALKMNNGDLKRVFALADAPVSDEQLVGWLHKEDEEGFQRCPDIMMSVFLNGLIYERRGKDESQPALVTERKMTNNIILKNCASRFR